MRILPVFGDFVDDTQPKICESSEVLLGISRSRFVNFASFSSHNLKFLNSHDNGSPHINFCDLCVVMISWDR